ncbi:hypothetical protein FACS189490_09730 [Clostridia bacterium]|nr:hypothetical protein FACS189490_09730 [Clostridia bacterium]
MNVFGANAAKGKLSDVGLDVIFERVTIRTESRGLNGGAFIDFKEISRFHAEHAWQDGV